MACDHLDKKTFDNAMEEIKSKYKKIIREYKNGLNSAMESYYTAWQSKKGWDKINALYNTLTTSLNSAGRAINKNYDTMKAGGEAYAKAQDMFLWIGNFDNEELSYTKKKFGEDQEIIIDEEKIQTATESLKASLEKIDSYIDEAQLVTKTDKTFGYYSTGDSNPRATLNQALNDLETSVVTAFKTFLSDNATTIAEDKAAREAAKQASLTESFTVDYDKTFGD